VFRNRPSQSPFENGGRNHASDFDLSEAHQYLR
jgi:hypothetical protein